MWFFKSLNVLLVCAFVTACGFHPLHIPIEGSSQVAVPLKISTIKDREGQILRNYLVDRLTPEGAPPCPQYILDIALTDVVTDIGINTDETANRKSVTVTASVKLRDPKTSTIVYTHSVKAVNSFAVLSQNYFSDQVAEDYAKKEALRLLADKITLYLVAYIESTNES